MRTLRNSLQDQDMGFLRIIAELWGFDHPVGSMREAAATITALMLDPETLREFVTALPPPASEALFELVNAEGTTPWHAWERKHGPVRVMGPARRDREQPWRDASSSSEMLWYRGFLGRAFIDTPKGPEEFAYIPLEIFAQLEGLPEASPPPALQSIVAPADRLEPAATIIDDCTTILAALRRQPKQERDPLGEALPLLLSHLIQPDSLHLCVALMADIGLLRAGSYEADLDAVRDFLLADRMDSLQKLYDSWKASSRWNDLSSIPALRAGDEKWPNDPVLPRVTVTRWIRSLKIGDWYDIADLVRGVYEEDPAFQRPGGNFDTWYLHDTDGVPLDGIEHWYAIEGALLRTLIKGPLRWFGCVQLGNDQPGGMPSCFSPTKLFGLLENPGASLPSVAEKGRAIIRSDGSVSIPRLAPRAERYQLARFLEWEGMGDQHYQYRLSIRALIRAKDQDLQLDQVRSILTQASEHEIPPAVLQSMQRLEAQAYEARIEPHFVLRISEPALLDKLLSHVSTKRFILERLSETTAIVPQEHWNKLARAAVSLGILIDGPQE